jgi:threonine aldolase
MTKMHRNIATVPSARSLPEAPRASFASDNVAGAHPSVLEALVAANSGHALAYGRDPWTVRAVAAMRALFDHDVEVLFVYGGTGANVLALMSLLSPAESVICAATSHINVDETGAPERLLGAKLHGVPTADGKINPADIVALAGLRGAVHHVQPAVVSITQPTELGTLYSPSEIRALCDTAHEHGMFVHLDGARIGNATAALGGTRAALRSFTVEAGVDVVSFGATKAGLVFGEAVVWLNRSLARRAEYLRKHVTQLHSKMRFISAQYEAVLADDLLFDLGARANAAARRLYDAVKHHAELRLDGVPPVNSLYPILRSPVREELQGWSFFWDWDVSRSQVRWMTAWDVTNEDVDRFARGVEAALSSSR